MSKDCLSCARQGRAQGENLGIIGLSRAFFKMQMYEFFLLVKFQKVVFETRQRRTCPGFMCGLVQLRSCGPKQVRSPAQPG